MRARIAEYPDEASALTYRDVPPLLSPSVIANLTGTWRVLSNVDALFTSRHVGRSFLANDGNVALTTPAFTLVDTGLRLVIGRHALRVQVQNLFDARAYASGYTDGSTRFFFPVATRTLLATAVFTF